MDTQNVISVIRQGLALVQAAEPLAALGGPAASGVANIIAGLAEIGDNALENITAGSLLATGTDQEELAEVRAQLQARNNQLDAEIRKG
jgi:hypothetical protein